jgi:hypothetical protein
MTPTRTSQASAPRDVDLERTRRMFLFAREQVAAHTRASGYSAPRDTRRRATQSERRADPVSRRPDANAR